MKLDPNAVKESDFPILPEGEYAFEVENATYQSNKDNTGLQWKMQLRIENPGNQPDIKVWDYFPEKENMMWKFNQFFKALGKEGIDDTDEMKNTVGEIGFVKLKIEPASNGHAAKNKVAKYIASPTTADTANTTAPAKSSTVATAAVAGLDISSDDLPF